ncbi:hypothetical protein GYMLUDRAFT_78346 [Collybiopsis luxurians FD-317 M1]|uniref:Uncharacterized protein n=1 Tax=Collybiopsis luxurians FD-317 M1 TaxID=944289 RepID=A0A0D0B9Z4_9AGAR|nr:hypothetical protein GYMLUDRAFT_78346 [Collybiopsis luxurians FD-317 M1]
MPFLRYLESWIYFSSVCLLFIFSQILLSNILFTTQQLLVPDISLDPPSRLTPSEHSEIRKPLHLRPLPGAPGYGRSPDATPETISSLL